MSTNRNGVVVLKSRRRSRPCSYSDHETTINPGSAAYRIYEEKVDYYSCPDIPAACLKDPPDYNNDRLDIDRVREEYILSVWQRLRIKYLRHNDPAWVACWRSIGNVPPSRDSCYKSTIVIPIALRNQVGSDFAGALIQKVKERSLHVAFPDDIGTLEDNHFDPVFGLLCMDHPSANYFDVENDARFAFILSDLFSIFLWLRIMYIDSSHIRNEAKDILRSHNLE